MSRVVAFLRGVNLGKRQMKMAALRESFASAGFKDARTLLASGNVVFEGEKSADTVQRIEEQLKSDFGFECETILRTMDELRLLADGDPFCGHKAGTDTKLYIFFLGKPEAHKLEMPCRAEGDFEVTRTTPSEIFAVAWRQPTGRFGAGLDTVGKPFGRYITNRNWNTVLRLIDMDNPAT